jgi:hypothetical protein
MSVDPAVGEVIEGAPMSQQAFLEFLVATRERPAMLAQYNGRNLAQLIFHAKNDGFSFSAEDVADVVGKLEANVILAKDRDNFDGTSRLWKAMWGVRHLEYLVQHVVARHTQKELQSLVMQVKRG